MGALFRSLLLGLGPVQAEITRAIEPTVRSAREALDTHRQALLARDQLVANLRERNDELARHNDDMHQRIAELEVDNDQLRTLLAAARQSAQRRLRQDGEAEQRRRRKPATATPGDSTTSDLLRCLDCSSLWLLSTTPDRIRTARRPVGNGCDTCSRQPLVRLWQDTTSDVPRPAAELPGPPDEDGLMFVDGLVKNGPNAAVATSISEFTTASNCAALNAIADGITREPEQIRNNVALCATGIMGKPDLPDTVLAEIMTRAGLEPADLPAMARLVRLVGARSCAAENRLADCPCARRLIGERSGQ